MVNSNVFHSITVCFFIVCLVSCSSEDPCKDAEDISNNKRMPSYVSAYEEIYLCDDGIEPDQWYDLGGEITSRCVDLTQCGTYGGIWYDGEYPKGDELVTGKVCGVVSQGKCCDWSGHITIKKCPDHYIYKLAKPVCSMSYCVGESVNCLSGQIFLKNSQICLNVPLINMPRLSSPYISSNKTEGRFTATSFSLDCLIDAVESNKTMHPYGKLQLETVFKMNDDVVASFTNDYPVSRVSLEESYLVGHLGKSLTCSVRFFYVFENGTSTSKTTWSTSSSYFIGVNTVDASDKQLKEVRIRQGEEVTIKLRTTFPITTRHCLGLDTKCDFTKYAFWMEKTNKRGSSASCATQFGNPLGSVSFESVPPLRISIPVSPGKESRKFYIKFQRYSQFPPTLFLNYSIAPILVVVDEPTTQPTCHSIGDPHFLSFSNRKFDNYFTGDFNLLSTEHRTFQVQIRQIPCSITSSVTCNCGVIAREGNNIIGINACDYRITPLTVEFMKDNVNPRSSIEKIGTTYTITFISGIKVNVMPYKYLAATFINVYVFGLKHEVYGGICSATSTPPDFNVYKIPYAQSFFKNMLPPCVNEVFKFPSCQCNKLPRKSTEKISSVSITCETDTPVTVPEIINLNNTCDVKEAGRKKRAAGNEGVGKGGGVELKTSSNGEESKGFILDDIFNSVDHSRDNDTTPAIMTHMSEGHAKDKCEKTFQRSPLYEKCRGYMGDYYLTLQSNCIDDIRLTGEEEIGRVYLSVFEGICKSKMEKLVVIMDGEKAAENELILQTLKEIQSVMCPLCLNDGTCINGTCVCAEGFSGADCFIDLNKPPMIRFTQRNSFCDLSSRPCHMINLEVTNIEPESDLSVDCITSMTNESGFYEVLRMKGSSILPGYFQCSTDLDNFNKQRQQRSRVDISLQVAVRNKRRQLESNELKMTIFDGQCLLCIEGECQQKENTCLIDNVCYEAMYVYDNHHQCIPSAARTEWSRRNDPQSYKPLYWVIITSCVLVVCTVIAIMLLKFLPERFSRKVKNSDEEKKLKS